MEVIMRQKSDYVKKIRKTQTDNGSAWDCDDSGRAKADRRFELFDQGFREEERGWRNLHGHAIRKPNGNAATQVFKTLPMASTTSAVFTEKKDGKLRTCNAILLSITSHLCNFLHIDNHH
jgi:hypothetical protein